MNKLDFSQGVKKIPEVWHPVHVYEIIGFLKSRGYNLEIYKELDKSKFFVIIENVNIYFKSCQEIGLYFINLYFEEKEKEEIAYFKERNEKQRNLLNLKEKIIYVRKN